MYVNIKVTELVAEQIRAEAKKSGMTISDFLAKAISAPLATNPDLIDPLDVIDLHLESAEDKRLKELQSLNLEVDELLPCCQKIYEDDVPRRANCCEHWELAQHQVYGQPVLSYRNKITGMFCDNPLYLENYAS